MARNVFSVKGRVRGGHGSHDNEALMAGRGLVERRQPGWVAENLAVSDDAGVAAAQLPRSDFRSRTTLGTSRMGPSDLLSCRS